MDLLIVPRANEDWFELLEEEITSLLDLGVARDKGVRLA